MTSTCLYANNTVVIHLYTRKTAQISYCLSTAWWTALNTQICARTLSGMHLQDILPGFIYLSSSQGDNLSVKCRISTITVFTVMSYKLLHCVSLSFSSHAAAGCRGVVSLVCAYLSGASKLAAHSPGAAIVLYCCHNVNWSSYQVPQVLTRLGHSIASLAYLC